MKSGLLLAIVLAAIAGACGGSAESNQTTTGDTFLAFATTFQGFRGWTSVHSDGPDPIKFSSIAGPRTEYINRLPARGATAFPVGTVIVEVHEGGDGKIFARVKRGGGFNSSGALDWEWFELAEAATGEVTITWRGFGPPVGESYGGDATGGCNGCHSGFRDNDYVASPKLQLSSLQ